MSVVINEFEVVSEPPPAARGGEGVAPARAAAPTARDIERILTQRRERLLRVWAH